MSKKRKYVWVRRWTAGLLAGIISCTTLFSPVSVKAAEASSAEGIQTSFYDISTALTAYANNVVGSNGNDKHNDHMLRDTLDSNTDKTAHVGNAGAFIGYGDESKGFYSYISASTAKSETTSSYDAWLNVGDNGGAYAYARYGYLLRDLGLDDTASGGMNGGRKLFGFGMRGVHATSALLPELFNLFFDLLDKLNPFRLLIGQGAKYEENVLNGTTELGEDINGDAITDSGGIQQSGEIGTDVGEMLGESLTVDEGAMATLSKYVSEIYNAAQAFGMYVTIPFMIAMLIWCILMTKADKWGRTKALILRLAFIVIGVPILGVLYTSTLNGIGNVVTKSPPASMIIGSSFVDFQSWVTSNRLGLPDGVTLTSDGKVDTDSETTSGAGAASSDTFRNLRYNVFEINKASGLLNKLMDNPITHDSNDISSGMYKDGEFIDYSVFTQGDTTVEKDVTRRVGAMLNRYGSGNRYLASAWETAVNGLFAKSSAKGGYREQLGNTSSTANASSNEDKIQGMYDATNEVTDWMDRELDHNQCIFKGVSYENGGLWANKDFNVFDNGGMKLTAGPTDITSDVEFKGSGDYRKDNVTTGIDPKAKGGLSTIAMYNYLSSDFTPSSISVYSAKNASSEFVKHSHFSVNLVGTGFMRTVYGLNCIAVLGVIVIISFVYVFGMLFSNIKRGIHMLLQIPLAMMGMLRSVIQVIIYVVVMIVEIVGTAFLYMVSSQLVLLFATIIESPIAEGVNGLNSTVLIGGRLASIFGKVLPTAIYDSRVGFLIGLFVVSMAIVGMSVCLWKARRQYLTVYEYIWCRIFRLVSLPEMESYVDTYMVTRKSYYVYDTFIGSSVENVLRSLQIPSFDYMKGVC